MLKKFELKYYKNFRDSVIIDFSKVSGYKYNEDCLSNQIISKMIIYGRNATGKTNLGKALLDIKNNLSPVRYFERDNGAYLNADIKDRYAEFIYTFQFGNDEIVYQYNKETESILYDEKLILNGTECFYYNFDTKESNFNNLSALGADTIVTERYTGVMDSSDDEDDNKKQTLPFLRWLISNTVLPKDSILLKIAEYIEKMIMINPGITVLQKTRMFEERFIEHLVEDQRLEEFEEFLNVMGIKCKLDLKELPEGQHQLYFKHSNLIPFFENASSGTLAITNLYRMFEMGRKASLMYLDEFDAYYHYEMSEKVIEFLKKRFPDCQTILTTHNTNLMTNRLMRPDCLFILSREGKLTALCDATDRELREGHNLEKMYISGEFEKYE